MIIFNYDGKSTFSFKNKEDKNIENIIPKELKGIKVKIWAISEERDFNIEYENGIFYHNGLKNRNINEWNKFFTTMKWKKKYKNIKLKNKK